MPCYVTLFWRKENISTNLCTFFSNAKTSSCSSDMTDGSYSILNLSDMCSCSPLFPLVVCCCCMSCCQHKIPWLCWQHRQIPSSPPPLRGKSERRKVTGVVHTFSCTRWPCPRSCVFSRMITWKPDQVSVVILKTPYWHHSLLLLHQASLFISTFFFLLTKPQTICLWHQSLKAPFTSSRAPQGSHSSWATGILCLQYSFIQSWATFPRTKRIQKTKNRSRTKRPHTLFKNDNKQDLQEVKSLTAPFLHETGNVCFSIGGEQCVIEQQRWNAAQMGTCQG